MRGIFTKVVYVFMNSVLTYYTLIKDSQAGDVSYATYKEKICQTVPGYVLVKLFTSGGSLLVSHGSSSTAFSFIG